MALADQMATASKHQGPKCTIPRFLGTLPDALRAEAEEMMANPGIAHSHLWRALKAEISDTGCVPLSELPAECTIRRHRNQVCRCWR